MEAMTLSEARSFVRTAIDEIQLNDAALEGMVADEEDLDLITDSKVIEAVTFVHLNAAREKIRSDAVSVMPEISINGKVIDIPANAIMRLLSFKGRDSAVAVTTAYGDDTPFAMMQSDEYAQGTYQNPVVIYHLGGNPHFTYHSLSSASAQGTDDILYIPYPAITGTGENATIDICPNVKLAILNHLTGLVLMVYKDNHAESFFNQAKAYM